MTDPDRIEPSEPDELLAEEVGRILMRGVNAPVWRDERFVEWFAADVRAGDRRSRNLSDEQVARIGADLLARVDARMHGVQRRYAPTPARAGAPGAVGVVELGVAAGAGRELFDEPPEQWIEVPSELPKGDYVALRIVGDSMSPLMHTNDTVLVQRGSRVQPNTVIVARRPDDGYVCKRVRRVGRYELELESLAPEGPSMRVPRRPGVVLGTVLMVWCSHR